MSISTMAVRCGLGPWSAIKFLVTHGLDEGQAPLIIVDTHDGDKRRRKRWDEEQERAKRRREQMQDAFERIVEGKLPGATAETLIQRAEADLPTLIDMPEPDFQAFLASLDRLKNLYDQYIEEDDMEVLAFL